MIDLVSKFEEYLFLYKHVSVNTYNAYLRDIQEFSEFLASKELTLVTLKPQDFTNYLNFLKKKRLGSATAQRKASSLKVFAKFLKEKYNLPDYSFALNISNSFPLLCNEGQLYQLIQSHKCNTDSYSDLRLYIILMLLSTGRIGVNILQTLTKNDVCFTNQIIRIFNKQGQKKEIELSSEFFELLRIYLKLIPYKTSYLFPIKIKKDIKPISRPAIWSIIKKSLSHNRESKTFDKFGNAYNSEIDDQVLELYRKNHPRP